MNKLTLLASFALTLMTLEIQGQEAWPELPKGKLSFKNLGDKYGKSVKTEALEITRDGSRIAQVTKIDRNADGKFEEFIFSAYVKGKHIFALTRLGGTNESLNFFSHDDTMVMADVRIPESKIVALVIICKEHRYYEIFTRHAEGYYWPADDEDRKAVDSFFRKPAEKLAPLFKELKK